MTSAGLEQQLIPKPFAYNGTITDIVIGTSDSMPSFDDGFPAAFSAPRSGGGEYILRGMMNAIGNLASKNEYYRQAGGLYQFNAEWARLNGGYAKGAVLDYLDGNKLYKVISLVDNNKVDYTQSTHTAAQTTAGIVSGGIDGVNWAYCNVATTVSYNEICDVPNFEWPYADATQEGSASVSWTTNDSFPIGLFKAPRNGVLTISGACNFSVSPLKWVSVDTSTTPPTITNVDSYLGTGFGIVVCSEKDSDERIKGPFEAQGDTIYTRGNFYETYPIDTNLSVNYDYSSQKSLVVTQGTDYQIYVINKGATIKNSTMKVVLI